MMVCYLYARNAAGVKRPYRISLRGSDYGFSDRGKALRILAHIHKGHALHEHNEGNFFYPYTATGKFAPAGIEPARRALLSAARQSTGRPFA